MEKEIRVMDGQRLLRSSIPIVIGTITVGQLVGKSSDELYKVPKFSREKNEDGYQRNPSDARIKQLKGALEAGSADLPTAILLNRRDLKIDDLHSNGEERWLPVSTGQDDQFYIVDGQHRVLALEKAYRENPNEWRDYKIPFVCMIGADKEQEMKQFYVINTKSKKVETGLAYKLLTKLAEKDADTRDLLGLKDIWIPGGQTLADKLGETSIWKDLIRYPNDEKKNTVVKSNAVTASLKFGLTLEADVFATLPEDKKLEVLVAYWQGIRKVYRKAFDEVKKYNVQHSLGVYVFHILLPHIVRRVYVLGKDKMYDQDVYAEILRPGLEELEGYNQEGEQVGGLDCWRVGEKGVTGSYSSGAGHKRLANEILKLIQAEETKQEAERR
ncbi:MAG: DGQHR domain-containing protein [Hyphomicrobiales bacterium]|nr:DGQHR domain-containing protein [Hyphomicrobiales bacterium]